MVRGLIAIVVIATAIGIMMPTRSGSRAGAGDNQAVPAAEPWFAETPSSSSTGSGSQGWGTGAKRGNEVPGGEVRLTRKGNGHFYADVEVNGSTVEFMVDTGATGIAMTEEDARKAGVRLDDDQHGYVGEGAGGSLSGHTVRLDRVRLGDKTATGVRAVVIDGASTNLLGQSFLSQFGEVTVRGDIMTLR